MAGDWIKVEHATVDKPEVLRIADLLGVSRREAIGILMDFWVWLDRNCSNAGSVTIVTHMSRKSIDEITHCAGFAACLVDVGWAIIDDSSGILTIINGERHNGNSAKTRALGKDRAANSRSRSSNANTVTREEKRREEIKDNTYMSSSAKTPNIDPVLQKEKSERREQAREILGFLNSKTGRSFRMVDANLGAIMARMKEGATVRDLRAVVARKCRDWSGDEKMAQYLRPATLFNATKFAQYVGEVPPQQPQQAAD